MKKYTYVDFIKDGSGWDIKGRKEEDDCKHTEEEI